MKIYTQVMMSIKDYNLVHVAEAISKMCALLLSAGYDKPLPEDATILIEMESFRGVSPQTRFSVQLLVSFICPGAGYYPTKIVYSWPEIPPKESVVETRDSSFYVEGDNLPASSERIYQTVFKPALDKLKEISVSA